MYSIAHRCGLIDWRTRSEQDEFTGQADEKPCRNTAVARLLTAFEKGNEKEFYLLYCTVMYVKTVNRKEDERGGRAKYISSMLIVSKFCHAEGNHDYVF